MDAITRVKIGGKRVFQARNITELGTATRVVEQHQEGSTTVRVAEVEGFSFEIPHSPALLAQYKLTKGSTATLENLDSGETVEYSGVDFLSYSDVTSDGKSAKWMTLSFHAENRLS